MTDLNGLMVEGAAEAAIIDILLNNNLLTFDSKDLISAPNGDKYQTFLSDKKFVRTFLSHSFDGIPIHMHIVCDNPNRHSKIMKLSNAVTDMTYYITREEIESIQLRADPSWIPLFENYKRQKNSDKKPSTFFTHVLKISKIKKYNFVYNLWKDKPDKLVVALQSVKSEMKHKALLKGKGVNYKYLADLLKKQLKNDY